MRGDISSILGYSNRKDTVRLMSESIDFTQQRSRVQQKSIRLNMSLDYDPSSKQLQTYYDAYLSKNSGFPSSAAKRYGTSIDGEYVEKESPYRIGRTSQQGPLRASSQFGKAAIASKFQHLL